MTIKELIEKYDEWTFKKENKNFQLKSFWIWIKEDLNNIEFPNQNDKIKELIKKLEKEYRYSSDEEILYFISDDIKNDLQSLLIPQNENKQRLYCANNHKVSPVWLNCPVCGDTSTIDDCFEWEGDDGVIYNNCNKPYQKSAKEMFEELGFYPDDKYKLGYTTKEKDHHGRIFGIDFYDKSFQFYINNKPDSIPYYLIPVIAQQLKEMGNA